MTIALTPNVNLFRYTPNHVLKSSSNVYKTEVQNKTLSIVEKIDINIRAIWFYTRHIVFSIPIYETGENVHVWLCVWW